MSGFDVERACPVCGREVLVVRKPVYEGFTRIGEQTVCTVCGHVFAEAESGIAAAPKRSQRKPSIFSEDDRPAPVTLFAEDEHRRLCRYCANYIVNPFRQWCSHHQRDVEATDTCDDFVAADSPEKDSEPQG